MTRGGGRRFNTHHQSQRKRHARTLLVVELGLARLLLLHLSLQRLRRGVRRLVLGLRLLLQLLARLGDLLVFTS